MNRLLLALKKTIPAVLLLGTLSLATAPTARGQLLMSLEENAAQTEVTITFSGTGITPFALSSMWGTTYAEFYESSPYPGGAWATDNTGVYSSNGSTWTLSSGQTPWSGDFYASGSSVSGNGGAIVNNGGTLFLFSDSPTPLTSGSSFSWSGSATYATSFSTAGVTLGSGTYVLTDTISTLSIDYSASSLAAVPEPSTYAAIFGAIALLGTMAVKRRAKRV